MFTTYGLAFLLLFWDSSGDDRAINQKEQRIPSKLAEVEIS